MKRTTMLCVAAAVAWSAALGAQTQQPSAAAQTVALIGCVEAGATGNTFALNVLEQSGATASATTGRQPDASISGQGRVGDAQAGITGQAQVDRRGTQGTGTAGMNFVGQRVQLSGDNVTNLKAHVGHRVEITGTLAPQPRGTGQPGAEARVNVRNVRMDREHVRQG